jgi:ABC-2 type transport system ATP-binding protein
VIDHGKVIAEGTADQLKSRVGGDVLEFRIPDLDRVSAAAGVVVGLGRGGAQVDNQTGQVVVPVGGDSSNLLIEVVRRLDAAEVPIADLSLRRPTLDDVFLALTGRTAEGDGEQENGQRPGRGPGRRGRQAAEAGP